MSMCRVVTAIGCTCGITVHRVVKDLRYHVHSFSGVTVVLTLTCLVLATLYRIAAAVLKDTSVDHPELKW